MPFTLRVQFTGLCLHVVHPDRPEVAVLLPDARFSRAMWRTKHVDGTPLVPHVGYLRADLANVGFARPDVKIRRGELPEEDIDNDDGPFFELIYRFRGETLDFGLPAGDRIAVEKIGLPDFSTIAPRINVRSDLFTPRAGATAIEPSPIVFRTLLSGGTLEGVTPSPGPEDWSIDGRLRQTDLHPIVAPFPGDVVWTRQVDADDLTLRIRRFDRAGDAVIPLQPVDTPRGKMIMLKIANLCATNPLEWSQFEIRSVEDEDADFKWLYTLFEIDGSHDDKAWDTLLGSYVAPAPRLMSKPSEPFGGGAGNCIGGQKTGVAFAPFDQWSNAG